ncbi:oligosaccharide flippase family protein [Siminovitchia fordii]|uniref:O-antigen translocase n=1 Tax=Siminovitchia fordii TaxID=254759 RepID=A0ABQ4KBQ7_9BACI|nr:oligosaccharide flippase family protein [Siminovitchia fordii]GIN23159.1 O-antigen translocase [Siminovitchia fordii]
MIGIKRMMNKNRFMRNFLSLFSATLFAQLINIGASPILTRIYSPQEFGYYSFYISICTILIVFVTGRYEYAINTVKTEKESQTLFKLVIGLSLVFSIMFFLLERLLFDKIVTLFKLESMSSLLYFIPLTLLGMGIMQGLNYYLNKHKNFNIIAKGKVLQSTVTSGGSIFLGVSGFNSIGLIFSNIIGIFISIFYQIYSKKLCFLFNIKQYNYYKVLKSAKKHRYYPIYNSTSAFFDNIAMQAPVFILMKAFAESIVGYYSLTVRVIGMPLTLISTSVSQVFLSEIAELHNNGQDYKRILFKALKALSIIGLLPTLFLILAGPWAFTTVFGEQWKLAGELSRILAFSYFAKFVVSPLSVIFFVVNRVKLLSVIQIIRSFSTVTVLLISSYSNDIFIVVISFTLHEIIFYLVYLFFILKIKN